MTPAATARLQKIRELIAAHETLTVHEMCAHMCKDGVSITAHALGVWLDRYRDKHPGVIRICGFERNSGGHPTAIYCLGRGNDAVFNALDRRTSMARHRENKGALAKAKSNKKPAQWFSGLGAC